MITQQNKKTTTCHVRSARLLLVLVAAVSVVVIVEGFSSTSGSNVNHNKHSIRQQGKRKNRVPLLPSFATKQEQGTDFDHEHNCDDRSSIELSRRNLFTKTAATAAAVAVGVPPIAWAAYLDPSSAKITKTVYLDVEWSTEREMKTGRIVIGLFGEAMPKTCENFELLCAKNLYAGSLFYRVLSGNSIQGGNIGDTGGSSSNSIGRTGRSAFAPAATADDTTTTTGSIGMFEPDNYNIKHSKAGLVSMTRSTLDGGADSRFFINTEDDAGWADDRYAAFGVVLEDGMETVVKKIEKVPVKRPQNSPKFPVKIVGSGIVG